jgi:Dullard-like phosphatase family protein
MINLNKVLSEFGSQNNNNLENNNEVFNIENNTNVEEVPKEPFLKPLNPKYKYTLVLDLDETLVHYISDNDSAYIQIRPGAEEFLKELSEYYEIIIFTAALQNYADLVIDGIDPNGVISDRLYRQHTINIGNINIKDLNKLGRDIKHIIIIDNFKDNYSLQPKNGLNIIDFEGNEYDDELEYLKEDLLKLVKLNPDDVRLYLEDIQKNMDKRAIYSQKINDENKNEVIDDDIDNDKNNLISDIINININKEDKIKSDYKVKIYKKGYSFTEESENAEVDKV